eukprot:4835235-Pyramimonas_sp.AAC.1
MRGPWKETPTRGCLSTPSKTGLRIRHSPVAVVAMGPDGVWVAAGFDDVRRFRARSRWDQSCI